MKTLNDGTKVSDRTFYYLLDFNDLDEHKLMLNFFNKKSLRELTIDEYKKLFELATTFDKNLF
jgi:hypothetical protein